MVLNIYILLGAGVLLLLIGLIWLIIVYKKKGVLNSTTELEAYKFKVKVRSIPIILIVLGLLTLVATLNFGGSKEEKSGPVAEVKKDSTKLVDDIPQNPLSGKDSFELPKPAEKKKQSEPKKEEKPTIDARKGNFIDKVEGGTVNQNYYETGEPREVTDEDINLIQSSIPTGSSVVVYAWSNDKECVEFGYKILKKLKEFGYKVPNAIGQMVSDIENNRFGIERVSGGYWLTVYPPIKKE
jgi:hypothetical protein